MPSIESNGVHEWPDSAVRRPLATMSAYFSQSTQASGTCSSRASPCPAIEHLWRISYTQCPYFRRQFCATVSSSNPQCWYARYKCNPTIAAIIHHHQNQLVIWAGFVQLDRPEPTFNNFNSRRHCLRILNSGTFTSNKLPEL